MNQDSMPAPIKLRLFKHKLNLMSSDPDKLANAFLAADFTLLQANSLFLNSFKLSNKHYYGSPLREVLPDSEQIAQLLQDTACTDKLNVRRAFSTVTTDGKKQSWQWISRPVREDNIIHGYVLLLKPEGQPGKASINQDIVNWQQATDAFAEPMYILDLQDRIIHCNEAFLEYINMERQQAIGMCITDIMHPEGEKELCPICRARLQRKDCVITMDANNINNPKDRPREVTIRMINDRHQQTIAVAMMIRDLSRVRAKEREIAELSRFNQLLLESTQDGVIGLDSDLRCMFINDAACRILGYENHELLNKFILEKVYFDGNDNAYLADQRNVALQAIIKQEHYSSDKETLRHKMGYRIPVHYSCSPVAKADQFEGTVFVFRDISESKRANAELNFLANHDNLTGLYNRFKFEKLLAEAVKNSCEGIQHTLCYFDLDRFKLINDSCGHVAGDALLTELGQLLGQLSIADNPVARLGGDEFAIIFCDCDPHQAYLFAQQVLMEINQFEFFWDNKSFRIGASVGLVSFGGEILDPTRLLNMADAACYLAKTKGRNRIHLYYNEDEELSQLNVHVQWASEIQQALKNNRFCLYTQKINQRPDNGLHAFEFLLRMTSSSGETVLPGTFLPAAERYQLITQIDAWVIQHALTWLAENPQVLNKTAFCTINISGASITDAAIIDMTIELIQHYQLAAHKICFEITETTAISNLSQAMEFLSRLKKQGLKLALDDFGAGMSSFTYLKKLPLDFVKIDGSFIQRITQDPVDFSMVQATHQVASVMGIETIAEHVDNVETYAALLQIGVNYQQGYYFADPKPVEYLSVPIPEI